MRLLLAIGLALSLSACVEQVSAPALVGMEAPLAPRHTDSSRWDREMLAQDLEFKPFLDTLGFPMAIGAWPVERYDTPGNGSFLVEFFVDDRRVMGRALHVGRGAHNEAIFPDSTQRGEVVALILVCTGTEDDHQSIAISRNHPDYLAQGRFKLPTGNVDWLTMQLADRSAYAIINMRLFDLRAGRVILVDPQADGSLRFLQRTMPLLDQEQLEAFVEVLAQDAEVIGFFR